MKNICKNCGKEYEFEPKRGTYKFQYCSSECKHEFAKKDAEPQIRICEYCHKEYWWDGRYKNYEGNIYVDTKKFCSFECGKAYKYEKIKNAQIEKYGAVGFGAKEIIEKAKQTKLERYGNAYYNNHNKAKQTNLEKYGVEYASQSEESRQKLKDCWANMSDEQREKLSENKRKTNLAKYGVEYVSQKEDFKQKSKETTLKRYGVENYTQTKEFKEKAENTCLEKYGVETYSKSNSFKEKIKDIFSSKTNEEWNDIVTKRQQTCLKKYGVKSASNTKEVRDKVKQTNLNRYGNEVAVQSDIVQQKIKENNLQKYGTEYSIASKEVQEKIRNTNLEKYGYEYPFQSEELRKIMEENRKKTNLKKYGTENIIQVKEFKEKAEKTCLEKYGVPYNCMTENCLEAGHSTISKINLAFKDRLDKLAIKNELEFHINKFGYDFLCNDKYLVEINPTFTHTSSNTEKQLVFNKPKDKYYHFNKTKLANENNYQCIHIWDWDDIEKILNMLIDKKKIYAKNLILKDVSDKECDDFLRLYHLQGSCLNQDIKFGLYKDDELIQLMTFGKPRYNKNYEYELLRLCTKVGYKVVGGAERLFKCFIKKYNPKSIISYCDNSKFSGDVYKRLNMDLKDYGTPRKHWYHIYKHRHITEALLLQRGYSQLHNDKEHKKGESNEQLMLEAGYLEVYDCGQSTYIWHKNRINGFTSDKK